jgi:parallel beta-helix repeat protein
VDCKNAVVENNTIIDATDGGIVIFQSPGSLIANNIIRAESRIMFYGISMEDYWPTDGDFTGTRVIGNIIDADGAMIREGIGMGPLTGCADAAENPLRSRGAIVTGNTLMGAHMAYGFVVGGVEDWTVTGNVDLSTHLVPDVVGDCFGNVVDPPAGFQLDPRTTDGTFQAEFEPVVLGGVIDMWPFQTVVSESCLADLIGADQLADIRAGNQGDLWPALEDAPNGERIANCLDVYQPPDVSEMPGDVGVAVLACTPSCLELRVFNRSDKDTADMRVAEFLLDDFSVPCIGLPASLAPWEETICTIESGVTEGFHVLT